MTIFLFTLAVLLMILHPARAGHLAAPPLQRALAALLSGNADVCWLTDLPYSTQQLAG